MVLLLIATILDDAGVVVAVGAAPPPLDTCLRVNTVATDTASALAHLQRGLDALEAPSRDPREPTGAQECRGIQESLEVQEPLEAEDTLRAGGFPQAEEPLCAEHSSARRAADSFALARAGESYESHPSGEKFSVELEIGEGRDGARARAHAPFRARVHETVPGVILVRGSGPYRMDYITVPSSIPGPSHSPALGIPRDRRFSWGPRGSLGTRRQGRGGQMKQVVVSRKCGEAVLRGADVRMTRVARTLPPCLCLGCTTSAVLSVPVQSLSPCLQIFRLCSHISFSSCVSFDTNACSLTDCTSTACILQSARHSSSSWLYPLSPLPPPPPAGVRPGVFACSAGVERGTPWPSPWQWRPGTRRRASGAPG